jgi:hypothetical protein
MLKLTTIERKNDLVRYAGFFVDGKTDMETTITQETWQDEPGLCRLKQINKEITIAKNDLARCARTFVDQKILLHTLQNYLTP